MVENPVEESEKLCEIAPVEVSETRVQMPEMEKSPIPQVNVLDLTKLNPEVQQGYRVFIEMSADSYKNVTWPFLEPVDAKALGLWDYHERVKEPMSFKQIGDKFNKYEYRSITEVIADIRLILENCYRYNGSDHWVSKLGHKMEKILEQKLALLNRSLRDKVSLEATMALRSDFVPTEVSEGATGRRRATRVSYVSMINGEESSSLLTRLKIQEDLEERERRRIREKEKKEANLVLLQDLAEWEEKELDPDMIKQLHSMWEIPSIASLLFLLKDFLCIQDLTVTELELSFIYASKSSLLARIFTALLITPHQRKSLFKKPPMKFKLWESKLCDRLSSWYKATEKDGQVLTCHQCGLDLAIFQVLGDANPLLEKSFMDLTLHQRVWILKCVCDNSLVRDYDLRDHLSSIAATEQREMLLGNDADNCTYLYFPVFSASDLRIYKQCPLEFPSLNKRKRKVATPQPPPPPPSTTKCKATPSRPDTPTRPRRDTRLRQLRSKSPSPEPENENLLSPPPDEEVKEPKNTIAEGFELSASDVESLKKLCEQFEEPPPPPKKRGRKPKPPPPRKRCEVELHQTLFGLLEELEKYEMSFSKLTSKAKIKIMKESQEPESVDEPEEVTQAGEAEEWGSEESIEEDIEDAGAQNMSSDEDFVLDDEENEKNKGASTEQASNSGENSDNKGNAETQSVLPLKRKADDANIAEGSEQAAATSTCVDGDDDSCSIAIQTTPPKLKKKRRKQSLVAENKPTAMRQTGTSIESQTGAAGACQKGTVLNKRNVVHIPAGMKGVQEKKTVTPPVKVATAGNADIKITNTVTRTVSTSEPTSSAGTAAVQKSTSSAQVHQKLPLAFNLSSSAVAPPGSVVVVPSSHIGGTVSSTVSKTSLSGAVTALSGLGKVMLVSSSGVPLQVLKAVPISQIQGKTINTSVLSTQKNIRTIPVGVPTTQTNSVGVTTIALNSPQLPSVSIPKVAIANMATTSGTLTNSNKGGQVSTTSASLHSPVLLVQRQGAGGVVPLAMKGGTIVVPTPSASQKVVVITPSSSLTSSTTSTTPLLSGTGISVVGNTQVAQTTVGQKVVLPAGVISATQTLSSLKPEANTVSNSKPVSSAGKTPTQSNASSLLKDSNPLKTINSPGVAPAAAENASSTKKVTPEFTTPSEKLTKADSDRVSEMVTQTVKSNCDVSARLMNNQTLPSTSQDTSIERTTSLETNLEQNLTYEDKSLPSQSTNCQRETIDSGDTNDKTKTDFVEKEQDSKNGSDPLVDLTCYEISVTDSAGCEENNDSVPNGLHPDLKISLPTKLTDTDFKLCNGVNQSATSDSNSEIEELDSAEQSHSIVEKTPNGAVTNET